MRKTIRKGTKIWLYRTCHGITKVYSAVVDQVRKDSLKRKIYDVTIDDGQGVVWWNRKVLALPCYVKHQELAQN